MKIDRRSMEIDCFSTISDLADWLCDVAERWGPEAELDADGYDTRAGAVITATAPGVPSWAARGSCIDDPEGYEGSVECSRCECESKNDLKNCIECEYWRDAPE